MYRGMEVDPPLPASRQSLFGTGLNPLKRSSSAPMINILTSDKPVERPPPTSSITALSSQLSPGAGRQVAHSSTSAPSGLSNYYRPAEINPRVRRFSASYTQGLHSPTGGRSQSQLDKIRSEELPQREVAHERETQSAMQISQSWEELTLDEPMVTDQKRPRTLGLNEPLHIFTSPYPYSSSPSPTRVGKQCFSPSLQAPVKNNTLTPSPSPSPTRKSFVREVLSPIALRPSPLSGIKRKAEFDENERVDGYSSPSKRLSLNPGCLTPEKTHIAHPLIHCISAGGMEDCEGDNSNTALQGIGTLSGSAHSCFTFRPVRHSTETQCTDSETSDMTEPNDINESNDANSHDSSPLSGFNDLRKPALPDT